MMEENQQNNETKVCFYLKKDGTALAKYKEIIIKSVLQSEIDDIIMLETIAQMLDITGKNWYNF